MGAVGNSEWFSGSLLKTFILLIPLPHMYGRRERVFADFLPVGHNSEQAPQVPLYGVCEHCVPYRRQCFWQYVAQSKSLPPLMAGLMALFE